jgi:hypothetical protein
MKMKLFLGILACTVGACGAESADESLGVQSEALTAAFVGSPTGQAATDISVVSRAADDFDEFTVSSTGLNYRHYTNSGGWSAPVALGKPPGTTSTPHVAASATRVSSTVKRLDVFVTASDNKIYHRFQTNTGSTPTFSSWVTILNNPTVDRDGKLGVASWGDGRIDLFWWTQSSLGHLGHAWADSLTWSGTESGDTAGTTYLQAASSLTLSKNSLAVAAKAVGKLDVYFVTAKLNHHWFDSAAGFWGSGATVHRESGLVHAGNFQTGEDQAPKYVAATANNGALTVVTKLDGPTQNGFGQLYDTDPSTFGFSTFSSRKMDMGLEEASQVGSVTKQSSPFRVDVWGARNGVDWQAFFL